MVAHACDSSTSKAKVKEQLQVKGQPGIRSEYDANRGYFIGTLPEINKSKDHSVYD